MDTIKKHYYEGIHVAMKFQFFMLMLFLVFVYFSPEIWFPALNELRVPFFISMIILLSCLPLMPNIPRAKQNWGFILLLSVSYISIYNSLAVKASSIMFEGLFKCIGLYFLMILILKPRSNLEKCFWFTLLFGSVISIGTMIASKLGFGGYRMTSFFGGIGNDPNSTAMLMTSLLPMPLSLLEGEKSWPKKSILIVMALSFAMCTTRTRSRGGFLGLMVVAVALIYGKKISGQRKIAFSLLVCALVAVFLYLRTHHGYWNRLMTMRSQETIETDESASARIKQYKTAFELFQMNPLFGAGIGSYRYAAVYYGLMPEYGRTRRAHHVIHNGYLSFLAETGLLGAALFVLIIVYSLKGLLSAERQFLEHQESFFLYKIAKGVRIGLMAFSVCLFFLPEQYNRMFYQLIAFAVVLKDLAVRENASRGRKIFLP